MQALRSAFQGRAAVAAGALLIFVLNAWIAWRLFFLDYLPYFYSIEGAFHAFARFISENWGNLNWVPYWYQGIPFERVYVPFLHMAVAAVSTLTGAPIPNAYHFVTAVAYSLGPVTAILMLRHLGATRRAAWTGALVYSLFSLSPWIMAGLAEDGRSFWYLRRLHVLVAWGEGPHILSMVFQCLAIAGLQNALQRWTPRAFALAGLAIASVILSNTPGSGGLVLSMAVWVAVQPADQFRRALIAATATGLLGYALSAWAVPPSHIATVIANSHGMHADYDPGGLNSVAMAAAVLALFPAGWLLRRLRLPLAPRFLLVEFALFAVVALTETATFAMVPQAGRLHLEMDRAFALLAGIAFTALYTHSHRYLKPALALAAAVALFYQTGNVRRSARDLLQRADPHATSEYKTAQWLASNAPGARVFAPGSTGFWLNAFADNPQLIGCCFQSRSHAFQEHVAYIANLSETTDQVRNAIDWLRIYGVGLLIAPGPESTEAYEDLHHPEKFTPHLPLTANPGGNAIYAVQPKPTSFAHILRKGEWYEQTPPGADATPESRRLADLAIDPARSLSFRWVRDGEAVVSGKMQPGDRAWVQVSHVPGWVAQVRGNPRPVTADGLGFVLIDPRCDGPCEIQLEFEGVPDLFWSRILSLAALIGVAAMISTNRLRLSRTKLLTN